MLPLTSSRWAELSHAYGDAGDVPAFLTRLATPKSTRETEEEEQEFLWSYLCHQGSVYSGTYAAMPHIVAIAATKPRDQQVSLIDFIGHAEAMRQTGQYEAIPADIEAGYHDSLRQAGGLIISLLAEQWSDTDYQILLGALAAVQGHAKLGAGISYLSHRITCPECAAVFAAAGYRLYEDETIEAEATRQFTEKDEAGYATWLNEHPLGIIVDMFRDASMGWLKVHLANCPEVRSGFGSSVAVRICAPDHRQLMRWMSEHHHLWKREQCQVCKPGP